MPGIFFGMPGIYLRCLGFIWDPWDLFGTPWTLLDPWNLFGTHRTIWGSQNLIGTALTIWDCLDYLGPPWLFGTALLFRITFTIWDPLDFFLGHQGLIWDPWDLFGTSWTIWDRQDLLGPLDLFVTPPLPICIYIYHIPKVYILILKERSPQITYVGKLNVIIL